MFLEFGCVRELERKLQSCDDLFVQIVLVVAQSVGVLIYSRNMSQDTP